MHVSRLGDLESLIAYGRQRPVALQSKDGGTNECFVLRSSSNGNVRVVDSVLDGDGTDDLGMRMDYAG